jgi:hypothetical protein
MTDVIASQNFLTFFHTTSSSDIIGAINSTFNGGAVFGALQGGLTISWERSYVLLELFFNAQLRILP